MKSKTESIWAGRIGEWAQSGQSATEFAEGKPFTSGTLTWAASQLRKGVRGKKKPHEVDSRSPRERKIRMAEVVRRASSVPVVECVVVEIGGAAISVRRGFDRVLLQEVALALRSAR